jgi:phage-related protein
LQKWYILVNWSVEFLDEALHLKLHSLPKDVIASFLRIVRLIELEGPQNVHEPYVKHLDGPIWEMRLRGRDGIARAAYVTAHARRVIIVHVFQKKTEKTPRREIEMALKRAKEVR